MGTNYKAISLFCAAILLFLVIAFFRTYFGLFPGFKNITLSIHFHVAMVLLWFAMLIVQPLLISKKLLSIHRLIGKASYILVPLLIFSFVLMTRNEQVRLKNLPVFVVNIFDVSIFILFYTLAIIYKRKTAWHSRFMVLTVIPFLSPSAARLHIDGIIIQITLLIGLFIFECFKGKVLKPYIIALSGYMALLIILGGLFFLKPEILDSLWNVFF
ncbi:MAG: hypothetical protein M3015_02440 [Bacteroidota bacterium]|nr:hypothetical protein [Bacteroidota bacterium]